MYNQQGTQPPTGAVPNDKKEEKAPPNGDKKVEEGEVVN